VNPARKAVVAVAMTGSTLVGGALGAYLFTGGSANAANTSATTSLTAAGNGSSGSGTSTNSTGPSYGVGADGKFHPNEDATHEAGESAAREAQETAGQVPTVP
jgi:hypothetical protein